ncbi:hypothetical protein MP638_005034 [Amoeboaphelidium occidentale]|nr:hypothetical protein MP638_005034 [Amoeboaphelidium occidentale]
MDHLLDKVTSLPPEVKVTATSRKAFNKLCRGAFSWTEKDKQNIAFSLCNAGYNVVTAVGESDVYLAKETRECCISSDSDILFHGKSKIWLVPVIRGNVLWVKLVSLDSVLATMKINLKELTALGVISGNDYSPNIKGFGIAKFKEMFKEYKVYVDLYGSFFDLIRYYALNERYRAFAKCLNEIFDGMDVIFVLDGARSAEKHEAHLARETQRDLRMQSFSHNLNSVDPQTFEKENLSFVQAPYEADVAISRLLSPSNSDNMSNTIIISNDSDLLFYGHQIVGKSFFKNKLDCLSLHFTLFREQIAIKKIGISRECWRALAVVAGNNHVSNLRGFGIARCLKEFQKINENGACTAEEMVEKFEQSHDKKGHFQIASAVFLNYEETSCAVCVESLQEQMFKDCCSQFQLLKEKYRAARAAKRQTTQGRSLQELKH